MGARIDKYDPINGGFRAPLLADLAATEKTGNGNPIGAALDTNGKVITTGVGTTGWVGLLCTSRAHKAGDTVDVMTDGEIVDCASLTAGTKYALTAAGALGAAGAGLANAGFTVEATRLVVRVGRTPPA